MHNVLMFIGFLLLLLGSISGFALLVIAIFYRDNLSKSSATLWGIFILGLAGGTIIMALIR
ncbi:MAG: hypothetical protein AAB116_08320 [Candidatus Poribacteria bacterium]